MCPVAENLSLLYAGHKKAKRCMFAMITPFWPVDPNGWDMKRIHLDERAWDAMLLSPLAGFSSLPTRYVRTAYMKSANGYARVMGYVEKKTTIQPSRKGNGKFSQ